MLETRLLRQFIAVAEELNFHRAAERLHMAQPPLSQSIRRLETEVGYALLERTNRGVTLLPAGVEFLRTARDTLSTLHSGVEKARRIAQGTEGHLNVCFVGLTPHSTVLHALRRFRALRPGVTFTLEEAPTSTQLDLLEQGKADLGFLRWPGHLTSQLTLQRVHREPILIALPAGHKHDTTDPVPLSAVANEPFVAPARLHGPGFFDQMLELCRAGGFAPNIVQEARQLHTVLGLVSAGFGLALVPASFEAWRLEGVVLRRIDVDAPAEVRNIDLFMAWHNARVSDIRDQLARVMLDAAPSS